MRFIYILTSDSEMQNSFFERINDDIITHNEPPLETDAYFTCNDFVFNYELSTLRIGSMGAYMPYFEEITRSNISLPSSTLSGSLRVGDTRDGEILATEDLEMEVSNDEKIIHAGKGNSLIYIQQSPSLIFGLHNDQLTDIYITLSTSS